MINDYLSGRKQKTKVGESFSIWREISHGVPQGSLLRPLAFYIYINDLFLFSSGFSMSNYADDCSSYESSPTIEDVLHKLDKSSVLLFVWYENNYLKPKPEKWHLNESGDQFCVGVRNKCIQNSTENILGVYFDIKLDFKYHFSKMCKEGKSKTTCPNFYPYEC